MARRNAMRKTARPTPAERIAKTHRRRLRVVQWALLAGFAVIVGRLIQLEVDPNLKLDKEDLLHIGQAEIRIPRGNIYDCNGRVLATDRRVKSLYAVPADIGDPVSLAAELAPRLGLDEQDLAAKLAASDGEGRKKQFVWVKRWLTDAEFDALSDFDALAGGHGLGFRDETLRFYPEGELAAQLLGFANREGRGCEGVELRYDEHLRSVSGKRVSRVDARRNFLAPLTLEYVPPSGGNHVELTIDAALQFTLERELDAALERTKAPRGTGILMDPRSGAILALACRPAFDPNTYWEYAPSEYKNRALVDVFEPGSSFKIVTAAAALELGLVTPETEIDCEGGSFNPYGHRIRDYHPLEVEPFATCFAQSSNIAIIKVAAMLGEERLEAWIRRFGFGTQTSSDFVVESPGIFRSTKQWSRYSMGSLPMGQEIAVTVPQLARAFSVIANGGLLVEPYLVERVVAPDGPTLYRRAEASPVRVLSPETAAIMRDLCHRVVMEGTGQDAHIAEYWVGGKTGTAQVALPNGGGYSRDKYTTIFAGFAPVEEPRVCAVIVIYEPGIRRHYGGYCCAPVFRAVVRETLIRLGCPESPALDEEGALQIAAADADMEAGLVRLDFLELAPEDPALPLDSLELVSHEPDSSKGSERLPSFIGMTKLEARTQAAALGLRWDPQGIGRVVEQEPPPGTPLDNVSLCRLIFSNDTAPERNERQTTRANSRT